MELREARAEDIPAIVNLLKQSLGESLTPKSSAYWEWKHAKNPFGSSPVMLCWDGDSLVGVRAFMRWEWIKEGQVFHAVRAVDTATHPGYQGKGIFKKLTLSLLGRCEKAGDHFVFNTPNGQSKPGYLKMGWNEAGKLPIRMGMCRPFRMLINFVTNAPQPDPQTENSALKYYIAHPNLANLLDDHHRQMKDVVTHASTAYLSWRYADVPVAKYMAFGQEQGDVLNGLIIARVKQTRFGRELRITDVFLRKGCSGMELVKALNSGKKEWKIDYVTMAGTQVSEMKGVPSAFSAILPVGPSVTVRALTLKNLDLLKNFNQWSPSLGDLELF